MPDLPADDRTAATELAPGAVRRERELSVPADEAWSLLRDAEGLGRWLADDIDLVVEPGESGTLRDGEEHCSVVVEEVEPGRRVALRWWTEGGSEADGALVDLTVEPAGDDRSRFIVTEVPLRVVTVPDTMPATWEASPARRPNGGGSSTGPQLFAFAAAGR